ncbi:MAG: hypothetical protein IPP33_05615 [Flavobacteriales bacterium]|nr:hypothetical protein [Flavobacteriales bacterium]
MINPMNFDELARRKLAEREFTFQQGDWTEMEALLGAREKKRRKLLWAFAALLLVTIPAAWWLGKDEPSPSADLPSSSTSVVGSNDERSKSEIVVDTKGEIDQNETIEPITNDKRVEEPAAAVTPLSKAHDRISPGSGSVASVSKGANQPDPKEQTVQNSVASGNTPPAANNNAISPDPIIAISNNPNIGQTNSTSSSSESGSQMIAMDPTSGASITIPAGNEPISSGTTTDADLTIDTGPSTTTTAQLPVDTTSNATPEGITPNNLIQDSTLSPNALPPPLDLVNSKIFHFEVGLLGGTFLSTGTYSGELTETWRTTSTGKWSPSFGAEFMTIEKHFGLGIGLHRARYEEQLRAEKLARTDEVINVNYSLLPIQITVPVITDTIIIGGVPYYVTIPTTITVNQLVTTRDTTQVERILREARSIVNRVDYWELPLLLDAHTSVGKWTFGVRGGPSVGFLSVRTGVIPDMEGTGYVAIDQHTYRTTLFGYQARAYVRYGLSDLISVGLEPTVRGQFGNAFEEAASAGVTWRSVDYSA